MEELFLKLIKIKPSKKFSDLRPWQREFCKYYDSHNLSKHKIFGINIPTGFGKTLIGLLIAKTKLDARKTCAIITQTDALVDKIIVEANELGIKTVKIPTKAKVKANPALLSLRNKNEKLYSYAQAIRISTYDLELYSGLNPADVLIIDDADMFVQNIQRKSSISLSRDFYPDIYEELVREINIQNYDGLKEIIEKKTLEHENRFIMINESIRIQEKFKELIPNLEERSKQNTKDRDDLWFKLFWEENESMNNYFPLFLTFISSNKITFQLLFPDKNQVQEFSNSQTILMSATLGRSNNIQQEFGLNEKISVISLTEIGIPNGTMGKRLIIPLEFPERLGIKDYVEYCEGFSNHFSKCLFLLYTKKESNLLINKLQKNGKHTITYQTQEDIDNFIEEDDCYLISVGRYIGIDIPSPKPPIKPCQITILTQIPYYISPLDNLYEKICGRNELLYDIIARRLIQSFGRCNREENSIGVYFIIDPELNEIFRRNIKYTAYFPKDIHTQLNTGYDNSEGGSITDAIDCATNFLQGSELTETCSNREINSPKINNILEKTFPLELETWNSFVDHNYSHSLKLVEEILHEVASITDKSPDVLDYISWLYYLKCMILEGYFAENGDSKIWETLKHAQTDLAAVSHNIFFSKYIHQPRKEPIFQNSAEEALPNDSITAIFLKWSQNPTHLFQGVWDSPYFEGVQNDIVSAIEIIGQNKYEEGLEALIPKLEKILRKIYDDKGGTKSQSTLNDFIDFFRSQKLICKNTQNHFKSMPNDFIELRNTILHGLIEIPDTADALSMFLQLINGIRYVINDIYFIEMLTLVEGVTIQSKTKFASIKMAPAPMLEQNIKDKWLDSGKNFEPDPSTRANPFLYNGKLNLKDSRSGQSETINVDLDFSQTI